ncbi:MAG TPA: hypothetical protein VGN65_14125, partial [Casimicrobiaceae bacterium]
MKTRPFFVLLMTAFALAPFAHGGEAPRQVTWDDLAVRLSAADNPFAKLSMDQLEALGDVAGLRDRKSRGVKLSEPEIATEQKAIEKL